jgi:hypothetical protein
MLAMDNATPTNIEKARPHLMKVARAIAESPYKDKARLISLAYNETRFGYKTPNFKSSWGACGIYQQVVRWSPVKTTCKKLGNPTTSTAIAVVKIKEIFDRWGKSHKSMCHYFSGNECDDQDAKDYALKHAEAYKKARKLMKKASVTAWAF